MVYLRNDGTYPFAVKRGDRIAQIVIVKLYDRIDFEWVEELSETERGTGGFGSTGR